MGASNDGKAQAEVSRPPATARLELRLPQAEKDELRAEARAHNISMAALVRINCLVAREHRAREELRQKAYPARVSA